jgi:hypothetical protein
MTDEAMSPLRRRSKLAAWPSHLVGKPLCTKSCSLLPNSIVVEHEDGTPHPP